MTIFRYHIAYGLVENPARVLAMPAGTAPILSPSLASFASDSAALRLNSGGWMSLPAEVMARLRTPEALKTYCRTRIEKKASIFDPPLQNFLARYLDVVEAEVSDNAASLTGGASWDAALYSKADWFFSAFLPLPNAHLQLTEEEKTRTEAGPFIRFDVMFWTGTSLVAVTLERSSAPTPRLRRAQALFAGMRPDITFVSIPMQQSSAPLRSQLPGLCEKFWHGLRHPLGPYRPEAFNSRSAAGKLVSE